MYEIKLEIALNENKKCITIQDIVENISLKNQKYFCPHCNNEVIARIGKHNVPHFSHKGLSCDNIKAKESGLHLLCKEILSTEKCIFLPQITIYDKNAFIGNELYEKWSSKIDNKFQKNFIYASGRKISFNSIKIENKINDIIPDIIIEGKKRLFVEIAVTHFIDELKKEKILQNNYTVLEIDMSDFINKNMDREEIKNELINSINNKKWINFSYGDDYIDKLNQVKNENLKIIQVEENKNELVIKKFSELESGNLYKYHSDDKVEQYLNTINFLEYNKLPSYLNVEIFGENVFKCDRRIWQTDIFYKFIYRRKNNSTINLSRILSYIFYHQKIYEIDYIFAKKQKININGKNKEYNLLVDAVKKFLINLKKNGFIQGYSDDIRFYSEYTILNKTIV